MHLRPWLRPPHYIIILFLFILAFIIHRCDTDENGRDHLNNGQNAKSSSESSVPSGVGVPILSAPPPPPAGTEPPPPPIPPPTAALWNSGAGAGGWIPMQIPGLITAVAVPTGAATLLTFPPLFPASAVSDSSILSAAFSPTAMLAKRDEAMAEKRKKHSVEEMNGNENNETEYGRGHLGKQFVGIRVRFNPPIFEETARLFYSVFSHEAQHLQIRPQRQCFAEGCFHLHTFRITGFQRPRAITLKPLSPNLLLLNILAFDVDIESLLNGNVQLLLTAVPVTGNFLATARQLSVTALFDLQKDQRRVPYLRIASCELRSGTIATKVSNLGLITDSINLKYKTEMLEKAKELIISTVCESISDTIRERVNHMLRKLPRALSVAKILGALSSSAMYPDCSIPPLSFQLDNVAQTQRQFFSNQLTLSYSHDKRKNTYPAGGWNGRFWRGGQKRRRRRRGLEMIDDETDKGRATVQEVNVGPKNKTTESKNIREIRHKEARKKNAAKAEKATNNNRTSSTECPQDYSTLLDFLDLHTLGQLFVDLDFLDSSAGTDFFAVGLSGDVFLRAPLPVSLVGGGVHDVVAQLELARGQNSTNSNNGPNPNMTRARSSAEEDKSLLMGTGDGDDELDLDKREFPPNLRFPNSNGARKSMELIFSDLTANLMLLQAHRAKLLKIRIGPGSSMFGPMLRTTCGPDDVCLSDSIPEAGEKHPDQQLEIEIEPVQPPRIKFAKDVATLHIIGAATFLLAHNGQPIGRIPFTASVEMRLKTTASTNKTETVGDRDREQMNNNTTTTRSSTSSESAKRNNLGSRLEVSLAIPRLEILEDVDFFELPASSLEGFRDSVRGAIVNGAAQALASGISLELLERRLCPYGISQPSIQLLDKGLVLISAQLDAFVLLFEGDDGTGTEGREGRAVGQCSPAEF